MENSESQKTSLIPPLPKESEKYNDQLAKGKILRYKIDFISVATVLLAVGTQFTAYYFAWPWYSVFILIILMRQAHLVQHNHAHLPIFRNRLANEVLGWLMHLNDGIPLESYRYQHVKIHHHYLGTEKDWTSPYSYQKTKSPDKPVRFLYYITTYSILTALRCLDFFIRNPTTNAAKSAFASTLFVAVTSTFLCWYDPRSFLLFYALIWGVCYLGIAEANWQHHVGCETDSIYTSANINLGFIYRLFGFNIGYHSAHHWHPTLHWTKLPQFHETHLADHTPDKYYAGKKPKKQRTNLP